MNQDRTKSITWLFFRFNLQSTFPQKLANQKVILTDWCRINNHLNESIAYNVNGVEVIRLSQALSCKLHVTQIVNIGRMKLAGVSKFEQFILKFISVNISSFTKFYFSEINVKWTYDALSIVDRRNLFKLVRTVLKNNLFTNNYPENLLDLNIPIFI